MSNLTDIKDTTPNPALIDWLERADRYRAEGRKVDTKLWDLGIEAADRHIAYLEIEIYGHAVIKA